MQPLGVAEGALRVGSQIGAGLGGGLTYLATLGTRLASGDTYPEADAAGQHVMGATTDALTYSPRTATGQASAGATDWLMSLPALAGNAGGTAVARWTDNPAAGAGANIAIQALPMALGARAVRAPIARATAPVSSAVRAAARRALTAPIEAVRSVGRAVEATSPEARLLNTRPTQRIQQENAAAAIELAPEDVTVTRVPQDGTAPAPQSALPAPRPQETAAPVVDAFGPVATPETAAASAAAARPGFGTRALAVARGVGGALAEPLTTAGAERAALRMMLRFGMRPEDFANLTDTPTSTGARLSVPEQLPTDAAQSATGAARLLDSLTLDPETAGMVGARRAANNAARLAQMRALAGEDGGLVAAVDARQAASDPLYAQADEQSIRPETLAPEEIARLGELFQRPAIADAIEIAQRSFANRGLTADPRYSIRGLDRAKKALDKMIADKSSNGPQSASIRHDAADMQQARSELIAVIEQYAPDYRAARETFAEMSRPINQAQLGAEMLRRGSGAENLAGEPNLTPHAMRTAMHPLNQPATIARALGKGRARRFDQVFDPPQLRTLSDVVAEISRQDAVDRAGKGSGSPTAQRIIADNIKQAIVADVESAGPVTQALVNTGVGALSGTMGLIEKASGPMDARIRSTLADFVLHPGKARAAFERATPKRAARTAAGLAAEAARRATPNEPR